VLSQCNSHLFCRQSSKRSLRIFSCGSCKTSQQFIII
jgi:hypothetical protein